MDPMFARITSFIPSELGFVWGINAKTKERQLQSKIETQKGTILAVLSKESDCRPEPGETWPVVPDRVLFETPGFAIVAVKAVPTPFSIAELGLAESQRQGSKPKPAPRPPTGKFIDKAEQRKLARRKPDGRIAKQQRARALERLALMKNILPRETPEMKAAAAAQRKLASAPPPQRGKAIAGKKDPKKGKK